MSRLLKGASSTQGGELNNGLCVCPASVFYVAIVGPATPVGVTLYFKQDEKDIVLSHVLDDPQ